MIGSDPADLVTWLQANEWLEVSAPVPVNLGGRSGLQVDVTQAKSPRGTCELPPDIPDRRADSAYIFLFGNDNFWVGKDEIVRMLVIDVDGKLFTILTGTDAAAEFPAFIGLAEPILQSLRFAPS